MEMSFFETIDMTTLDSLTEGLSERGACLLTGKADQLTHVAVDTNIRNILPDNIALLSKEIVNQIIPVYEYCVTVGSLKVMFESSNIFEDYNLSIMDALKSTNPDIFEPIKSHAGVFKVWETLASRHCKGISKISVDSSKVSYCLDKVSALQALTVMKVRNKKESKIVSPSGESIYEGSKIKIVQ